MLRVFGVTRRNLTRIILDNTGKSDKKMDASNKHLNSFNVL